MNLFLARWLEVVHRSYRDKSNSYIPPEHTSKGVLRILGFSVQKVLSLFIPGAVAQGLVLVFAREQRGFWAIVIAHLRRNLQGGCGPINAGNAVGGTRLDLCQSVAQRHG